MPDWKDIQKAREQHRIEEQNRLEMEEFYEDIGLIPEEAWEPSLGSMTLKTLAPRRTSWWGWVWVTGDRISAWISGFLR